MLSHGNLVSNARASAACSSNLPDDLRLCWLPLSHIYARTSRSVYAGSSSGSQLALAEGARADPGRIAARCIRRFSTACPISSTKCGGICDREPDGESPGRLTELLGGRMRFCCSGGAALPDATAEFFWRHGVPLVQGYGLTESSPVITIVASRREPRSARSAGRFPASKFASPTMAKS